MDALVLGEEGPVELPAWVQKRSRAFDPCYKPSDLDFILDFSPARRRFPSTCLRSLICLIPRLTSSQASAFLGEFGGKLLLRGQPKAPHRAALLHGEMSAAPTGPLTPSALSSALQGSSGHWEGGQPADVFPFFLFAPLLPARCLLFLRRALRERPWHLFWVCLIN